MISLRNHGNTPPHSARAPLAVPSTQATSSNRCWLEPAERERERERERELTDPRTRRRCSSTSRRPWPPSRHRGASGWAQFCPRQHSACTAPAAPSSHRRAPVFAAVLYKDTATFRTVPFYRTAPRAEHVCSPATPVVPYTNDWSGKSACAIQKTHILLRRVRRRLRGVRRRRALAVLLHWGRPQNLTAHTDSHTRPSTYSRPWYERKKAASVHPLPFCCL